MGLSDVKKGLEKQLKQERQAIEKETATQREELLAEAHTQIEAFKHEIESQTQDSLMLLERRETSSAKLLAKKRVLEAKKGLIDEAFTQALNALQAQSPKQRQAILERLVKKASQDIDVHTVHVAPQDKDLLKEMTVKTTDIQGGVICENKNSTQRVDLSYETLLAHIREQHLKEIAQALF